MVSKRQNEIDKKNTWCYINRMKEHLQEIGIDLRLKWKSPVFQAGLISASGVALFISVIADDFRTQNSIPTDDSPYSVSKEQVQKARNLQAEFNKKVDELAQSGNVTIEIPAIADPPTLQKALRIVRHEEEQHLTKQLSSLRRMIYVGTLFLGTFLIGVGALRFEHIFKREDTHYDH